MNFEIEITRRCNFSCIGCDRLCNIVKDNCSDMSLEEIHAIAEEINQVNAINKITVIGGEPTLNPDCYSICKCLKGMIQKCKTFELATNHTDNNLADKISSLGYIVRSDDISLDPKEIALKKMNKHFNILMSPIEENLDVIDPKDCWVLNRCGVSIHKYKSAIKYCWCGAGTSICKLLQREEHMKSSLIELLEFGMSKYFSDICQNCMYLAKKPVLAVNSRGMTSNCFKAGLEDLKRQQ